MKLLLKIEVENIKCYGCAGSLQSSLLKINGTQKVDIDIDNDTVTAVSKDTEAREKIVIRLAEMGYPEKENNTLIKKESPI